MLVEVNMQNKELVEQNEKTKETPISEKNKVLINKYIDYLKYERKLADNTLKAYNNDLKCIRDLKLFKDLTYDDVLKYLKNNEGYTSKSIAHQITVFNSFFNYLRDENIVKDNPFDYVSSPKVTKSLPKYLTEEEVNKLLDVPISTIYDFRDKAMLEVLYGTGLRVSELSNLKISNVDFNECVIRVMGKGSKERIVPVNDTALGYLKRYIEDIRPQILKKHDSEYLFISNAYKNISRVSIFKVIKKQCLRAGIKKDVSPHVLRHSFATHLLMHGANIRIIQELLGHEDLATTEIYTHVINEQLKKDYETYHPRSHKD